MTDKDVSLGLQPHEISMQVTHVPYNTKSQMSRPRDEAWDIPVMLQVCLGDAQVRFSDVMLAYLCVCVCVCVCM